MTTDDDATRIPEGECPKCGYRIDATSEAYSYGGAKPRPGDISMCLSCGYASFFAEDLSRRVPNAKEALEISLNPEVMKAQIARSHLVGDKLKKRRR